MNQPGAEKAVRENFSGQLMALGKEVSEYASKVKERQGDRLAVVTRQPEDKKEAPGDIAPTWPPLLHELRSLFWGIKADLEAMNETLDRLEI